MTDATEKPDILPTDLGEGRRVQAPDKSTGMHRIDLGDRDRVFDLALELLTAPRRRLMQVTLDEWRAIARLAVTAAPVFTHAIAVTEQVVPGEPWDRANGELLALVKLTRQLLDAERTAKP